MQSSEQYLTAQMVPLRTTQLLLALKIERNLLKHHIDHYRVSLSSYHYHKCLFQEHNYQSSEHTLVKCTPAHFASLHPREWENFRIEDY